MRITILGATGGIGGHLLTWALEAGHHVHVLARHPEALSAGRPLSAHGAAARGPAAPDALAVTRGDVLDAAAVAGGDAVLSALGPRGAMTPGLLAGAAENTVAAMRSTGARRLICVSAAGAFITADPPPASPSPFPWLVKQILPRVLAGPFADVRRMEDVISGSGLDWTLVRATRLVNTPLTGRYRVAPDFPPRGGGKISRAAVAHFMATALTEDAWLRSAPALAY
jgi:uncharacterized protein YbjT (DUF2867 family)